MNDNGVLREDGSRYWQVDGKFHRIDGPAYIDSEGSEEWYQNDKLHRLDGPAITNAIYRGWWQNGNIHRLDGPAIIYIDGKKFWYTDGLDISIDVEEWIIDFNINSWEEWTDIQKLLFRMKFQ